MSVCVRCGKSVTRKPDALGPMVCRDCPPIECAKCGRKRKRGIYDWPWGYECLIHGEEGQRA